MNSGRFLSAQRARVTVVVGAVVLFLVLVSLFYVPRQGFSALLLMGDHEQWKTLPELRELDLFIHRGSPGYDAQQYVQLALRPEIEDPELRLAVDNLPYRARRIALSWTAWLLGGGEPHRIVQVYAVQNVAAWIALAVLLLRWLPPSSWSNVVRWLAVMFTAGLCFSVRGSLVDGPGLFLIALAVALIERGRRWSGALILACGGMVRETNILAAIALVPTEWRWRAWAAAAAQVLLVAGPVMLWFSYVSVTLGRADDVGTRNFTWPLAGWWWAFGEAWRQLQLDLPFVQRTASLLVWVGLTTQAAFLLARPQLSRPWWRVGLVYVLLMIPLGVMVWEGQPGAVARVLLPITVAFNILVPHGRRWWAILLIGNLPLIPSVLALPVAIRDLHRVTGPAELRAGPERGEWRVVYDQFWYGIEASRWGAARWRWAGGTAGLVIFNPHPSAVVARLSFELGSDEPRQVQLRRGEGVYWEASVGRARQSFEVGPLELPPGYSHWIFATEEPPVPSRPEDARQLAFQLRNLRIQLDRLGDGSAGDSVLEEQHESGVATPKEPADDAR